MVRKRNNTCLSWWCRILFSPYHRSPMMEIWNGGKSNLISYGNGSFCLLSSLLAIWCFLMQNLFHAEGAQISSLLARLYGWCWQGRERPNVSVIWKRNFTACSAALQPSELNYNAACIQDFHDPLGHKSNSHSSQHQRRTRAYFLSLCSRNIILKLQVL